jgi:phosphoglycolate phosphatase
LCVLSPNKLPLRVLATAQPTPGAHDLIHAWSATGRPLAIVSNNSTTAIRAYVDLHNLQHYVSHISARTNPDPALLKPNPQLLTQALAVLNVSAAAATFFGDSITDVQAACAAGTMSIGYTNKPGKAAELMTAGADTVIHAPVKIAEQIA